MKAKLTYKVFGRSCRPPCEPFTTDITVVYEGNELVAVISAEGRLYDLYETDDLELLDFQPLN